MTLNITRANADSRKGVSILCLVLLGGSFLVGVPFLFSSSLATVNATTGGQLNISVAPQLLVATSGFNAMLSVQLLVPNSTIPIDNHGNAIQVVLTSNNTNVASVTQTLLYIPPGRSYATEVLLSGGSTGNATITASAQGYLADRFVVTARNPLNDNSSGFTEVIHPYFAPRFISNDNYTYPNMVIGELQTLNESSGIFYPALATRATTVWARSSDNQTMQVSTPNFTIPTGGAYSAFDLTSTYYPGMANITFQADNWNSNSTAYSSFATAFVVTSAPTPTFSVQNTLTPSRILPGQKFKVEIYAQVLNAPISPIGANLTWSSNIANVSSADSNLNATQWGSATFVASNQTGEGLVQVLIKQNGIQPYLDNITVNVYLNNFTIAPYEPHPSVVTGYTTPIGIHVSNNNNTGVANATVTWTTSSGKLLTAPSVTNRTGYAIASFQAGSSAGNASIVANVSMPGYNNVSKSLYITVQQVTPPPPAQKKQLSGIDVLFTKVGNVLPLWAIIPIAGGAGGAGFFFYRRRQGSYEDYEDEE